MILHEEITEKIIQAFYKVNNTLGHGFIEKVYENALAIELRKMGFIMCHSKRRSKFTMKAKKLETMNLI